MSGKSPRLDSLIKKKLFSSGMWVVGGKLFALVSGIAVNALLARLLTPKDMGLYFLVASLVTFFMMLSLLGMERLIVRIVAESLARNNVARARQAIHYVLQFGLLFSVIVAGLLVAGAGQFVSERLFRSPLIGNIIYLPAIWLVIFTLQTLIAESFRGLHDIRFATLFNGLISSIITGAVLGFVFFTGRTLDIQSALLIIIGAYGVNLVLGVFLLHRHTGRLVMRATRLITRADLMKHSWPLYLTNIFIFIMNTGPLWLLAHESQKADVAIFGAAIKLMTLITTSLALLKLTILPTIGQLYARRQFGEVEKLLRTSATLGGIPAIIGLSLVILMGKDLLLLIFGAHYAAGYQALLVLAVANMINVLTGTPGALMVMASKERYLMMFAMISGGIGLAICVLLVGTMGYVGVAIGQGVGLVLYNVLMVIYCNLKLSINTLMSFAEFLNLPLRFRYAVNYYAMAGWSKKK